MLKFNVFKGYKNSDFLEEEKRLRIAYNKIISCIVSSGNLKQIFSCRNMMVNFHKKTIKNKILFQDRENMFSTLVGFFIGRLGSINEYCANYHVQNILKIQV